ncbi:chemotaxis protein CheW [Shewanella mangrovi]|uniref:Chemotaxis protein CheW n=1 Tax=Shewanella mangrovi TaxID=1515746 RepID=A0A094LP27_9GAMM|nr:chemotaxis protein CheW [Shewanella mangrovi]KFZ36878.1 chemotaxis protein CheW [Shewanella mangrovi]
MSKSVDETVFDYFSLLLSEPEEVQAQQAAVQRQVNVAEEIDTAAIAKRHAKPVKQEVVSAIPQPEVVAEKQQAVERALALDNKPASSNLDKQALEKLLSSVVPEVKTASITTENTKVETSADPQVDAVPITKVAEKIAEKPATAIIEERQSETEEETAPATQASVAPPIEPTALDEQLDDEFQVLFFKVAGLTLAVPLISLGGIVQVEHVNHIIGRPKWFLGVQQYRDSQLNLVNTAAWVMPEKYDEKLAQSVNYQYLVVLENSNWGLACESLINAVKIDKSQVNWRGKAGKRPWLAGVVKEQMCGILHVQSLIDMLNAGLGCQDPIN